MIPAGWPRALLVTAVAVIAAGAALPTGGAGAGGQLATRLAAFGALALAALVHVGRPPLERLALPLAAVLGLASLALLQSLVWPLAVVRAVSSEHAALSVSARSLLGDDATGAALSLAPELSRAAALAAAAVAAVLFAAFVGGAERRHRRWLALALVAGGLFQVVFGARAWLAGTAARMHGTFVNPNHLAYGLEIALAVAFAWAAWGLRAGRHAGLERRLGLVAPPVAAWLLLAGGLGATGSRAGLAAAAVGVLLQSLLLPRALGGAGRGLALKTVAAAALAGFAFLVVRGADRLGETTLYEVAWGDRAIVWSESLALWLRFPLTGSGLGTFGEAFPLVQPAAMTELYWRRAHNDPVELLVTGGLVGVALGLFLTFGAARALGRTLARGERSEDRLAGLAALGACASVATHELLDFGLTLPGIALPLAALVGAAAAARLRPGSRTAAPTPVASSGEGRGRSSDGGVLPGGG